MNKMETKQDTFAERVYTVVSKIPRGSVSTYGAVAIMAGVPRAARAVGNILHRNPYFGEVPCHRVVHADGKLANSFAFGGVDVQKQLLEAEGVEICENRVVDMQKRFYFQAAVSSEES